VLERVERGGAYADLALRAALERSRLGPRDRAFATELLYGTLRWRGRLDFLLKHLLERDLGKLELRVALILRLGAYQLLYCDGVPTRAAVSESVRCARAAGLERATGLVNAVLRRLAQEHAAIPLPALDQDPAGHLSHALSLPGWIAERWLEAFGAEEAARLARASNAVPPRTLRANRRRVGRDVLLAELRERFAEAVPSRLAPDGILVGPRGQPARDPAFLEGRFTIQDEASQLVVELLDPRPGERILDACAAPGTKSTAIAERIGGDDEVVALDRHERRLGLLQRDVRRLGLRNVRPLQADATRPLVRQLSAEAFDRILVDAPCSGLGTLRRNPDLRWRLRPEDPERLAETQRGILKHVAPCLRPGGTLVYSTCTLSREENEEVVAAFLGAVEGFHCTPRSKLPPALQPLAGPDGWVRLLPHVHDTDGFFAARFERRA
jgi:16S rRNA (cytosine967-C5)-methyltransferase